MSWVLVGAGGHCRSCIEALRSGGQSILGVLDPSENVDSLGAVRLGSDDWILGEQARDPQVQFMVTVGQIGNPRIRVRIFGRLLEQGLVLGCYASPLAWVAPTARLGAGTIALQRATVNANAVVGQNVILNTACLVEHDALIGDHSHISTGVIVNGHAVIGRECFVGSGAVIGHGVEIPAGTVVGAGSIVLRSIPEPGTWVGSPVRKIC